ncbi:MAG: hypothetical protein [Caudoviricetes sp.]|nr:MAG: hypothetical protein [Caudoviricetes sp.]
MKAQKPAKKTRQQLEREILELQGQLASSYHFAASAIGKASTDHCMGGGVMLTLTATGGREIVKAVCIRDGLSKETIEAIKADLVRSYELATAFKPKV